MDKYVKTNSLRVEEVRFSRKISKILKKGHAHAYIHNKISHKSKSDRPMTNIKGSYIYYLITFIIGYLILFKMARVINSKWSTSKMVARVRVNIPRVVLTV